MIKAILVKEGQSVEAGQALIELDATQTRADISRLEAEYNGLRALSAVNRTLIERISNSASSADIDSLNTATTTVGDRTFALANANGVLYQRLLQQRWAQYQSQTRAYRNSVKRNQSESLSATANVDRLTKTLPLVTQRAQMLKDLKAQSYAAESDMLTLEQERIDMQHALVAERHRVAQLQAAEAELNDQIDAFKAETISQLLAELTEQEKQLVLVKEELTKAHDRHQRQVLYAPTSGRVQELAITTVGGVVTDAQQLLLIVPDEQQLEAQVYLPNKDIGFVNEGMAAQIKVHTFPFTKYGVINGQVKNISDDAIVDEQQGLIYSMLVSLESNTMMVNGKAIELSPGMAVTAEMSTGTRKLMEYFLAPLMQTSQEALRER